MGMSTPNSTMNRTKGRSFWHDETIQKQPKKREDLQKRLAAYYQSVRGANDYYQPTVVKNTQANLWAVTPVPRAVRHLYCETQLETSSDARRNINTAVNFSPNRPRIEVDMTDRTN